MVPQFPMRFDAYPQATDKHKAYLTEASIEDLVKDFFEYLEYTEESDSGRVFHPIEISCCRVAMSQPLSMLLQELKKRVKHEQ